MCPVGLILFWQRRKYKIVNVVIIIKCLLKSKIFQVSLEDKSRRQAYRINLTSSWKTTSTQSARPESYTLCWHLTLKSGITAMPITLKSNLTMNYSDIYKKQFKLFITFLLIFLFFSFFRSVMQILRKIKVFTSTFGFHDLGPSFWVCKNNNPYGFSRLYFWNLVAIQILTDGAAEF